MERALDGAILRRAAYLEHLLLDLRDRLLPGVQAVVAVGIITRRTTQGELGPPGLHQLGGGSGLGLGITLGEGAFVA